MRENTETRSKSGNPIITENTKTGHYKNKQGYGRLGERTGEKLRKPKNNKTTDKTLTGRIPAMAEYRKHDRSQAENTTDHRQTTTNGLLE